MPEARSNRRVRFTRSALREALIDLILEKPLVSITVKDICARADINRSTFYLHFKDVTDILRTTEDEIIEHMREHAPTHEQEIRDRQEIEGFFTDFLEQIRSNPRIMKVIQVLCSEQGDPYFVRKLQTMTYEAFLEGCSRSPIRRSAISRRSASSIRCCSNSLWTFYLSPFNGEHLNSPFSIFHSLKEFNL